MKLQVYISQITLKKIAVPTAKIIVVTATDSSTADKQKLLSLNFKWKRYSWGKVLISSTKLLA